MRHSLLQRLCHTRTAVRVTHLSPKIPPRWLPPVAAISGLPTFNYNTSHVKQRCHYYSQKAYPSTRSTIFALSSGHGKSGVAVIRISGPKAASVAMEMTRKSELPEPRRATLTGVYHHSTGEMLDRGMVLWFPGKYSDGSQTRFCFRKSVVTMQFTKYHNTLEGFVYSYKLYFLQGTPRVFAPGVEGSFMLQNVRYMVMC